MAKIVALVDGSTYSRSVCDHAAWAAKRTSSSVELLHVIGRRIAAAGVADFSGNLTPAGRDELLSELAAHDEQAAKLAQRRARAILDDARNRMVEDGIGDVTARLRVGDLVETLKEVESQADLVVIGKRGEAADFAKLHLGSNLERVVRSSHKPILVASRAFRPISRLLVAFDGGPSSTKAVAQIAQQPLFQGIECHVVTVGSETEDARRRLEASAATLRAAGYTVRAEFLPGRSADEGIAGKVAADQIDLLVMGAYGHSRIRSLIIGSTTTEMIRSCLVPVMLFR